MLERFFLGNKKLNILFSHYGIKNGDGWGRSFFLARELAGLGHKVTFLTSQFNEFVFPYRKEIIDNVEVISFPDIVPFAFRKGGIGVLNILLKSLYVLFQNYEIVHSDSGHRPSSGIPCVVHRFLHKSKYVSEWWDYFGKGGIYDEMPWWYKLTLGNYDTWAEVHNKLKADGVIALSIYTKKRALNLGIKENKVEIIQGGADVKSIKYFPNTNMKEKFGIDPKSITFGFIGMNEEELNDLIPFISAINNLKKIINITWFTTGRILSKEVKQKFGIGEELIEFGWMEYAVYSNVLSCADAFLLLLKDNLVNKARWPNKLGDYLAAGRPIVTTEVGDMKLFVGINPSIFFTVNDFDGNYEKLIKSLYSKKKENLLTNPVSRAVAEKYSWEKKSIQLQDFYNYILAEK